MGKRQIKRRETEIKNRGFRDLMIAVVIVVCSGYLLACTMPRKGRILNHVHVNHVDVSGLNVQEAARLIQDDFEDSYAYQSLTVEAAGDRYSVLINKSLEIDAIAAADKAYQLGHGNFMTRGFDVVRTALISYHISWNAHIADDDALAQAVQESGLADINTTTQTEYEIEGDELILKKGAPGFSVDQTALVQVLKEAVGKDDYVSVIDSPMLAGTVEPTDMNQIYSKVHKKKRNAALDPDHDYQIIRSQKGIDFDVKSAQEAFDAAEDGSQVVIPLDVERADITTDDLKSHLFKETLASCSTGTDGSESRLSNIKLAIEKIDGLILLAGETFSYNDAVGERTQENGFVEASAYADGDRSVETGGGICQVASSLYKAAVESNLKIKEHHTHKYISNYIDMGMDTDISWEGADFRFTNNMKYPVKILAGYEDGQVTVELLGARPDSNHVEFVSETEDVIEHRVLYVEDPNLVIGQSETVSYGEDGYVIQTYRNIYDKENKLISSKKEEHCEYASTDTIIHEGTAQPESEPAEEGAEKGADSGSAGSEETGETGAGMPASGDE